MYSWRSRILGSNYLRRRASLHHPLPLPTRITQVHPAYLLHEGTPQLPQLNCNFRIVKSQRFRNNLSCNWWKRSVMWKPTINQPARRVQREHPKYPDNLCRFNETPSSPRPLFPPALRTRRQFAKCLVIKGEVTGSEYSFTSTEHLRGSIKLIGNRDVGHNGVVSANMPAKSWCLAKSAVTHRQRP